MSASNPTRATSPRAELGVEQIDAREELGFRRAGHQAGNADAGVF